MFTDTRPEGRPTGNLPLAQDIVTEASRNVGDVSFCQWSSKYHPMVLSRLLR